MSGIQIPTQLAVPALIISLLGTSVVLIAVGSVKVRNARRLGQRAPGKDVGMIIAGLVLLILDVIGGVLYFK